MTIVELRQYTLKPGRRDELITLFEREFVESQEAEGVALIGQFRDLDAPDRFVWLRGFPDMERRRRSLEAFYTGPVWQAHREAANATMIDSDDVLLLRPLAMEAGFGDGTRPPPGSTSPGKGAVAIGVHRLSGPGGSPCRPVHRRFRDCARRGGPAARRGPDHRVRDQQLPAPAGARRRVGAGLDRGPRGRA